VTVAPAHRFEPAIAAALLSAGAAAIHASAAGPHFAEHLAFGGLFVVTALAQAAWAALVLTAPSARLVAAGVLGNVGVAIAWALSRTVGLPFDSEPWVPEPVGALDLAATSFEVVAVAAGVLVLGAGGPYRPVSGRAAGRFATVAAVVVAAATSAAFAGTPAGGHDHGHAAAPAAAPAAQHHHAVPAKNPIARPKPKRAKKPAAKPAAHAHAHAAPHAH
jgi:hypothetical protein